MSNDTTTPPPRRYDPAEANRLEAAIRNHGIDPDAPASYPIWSIWEKQNLAAALDFLGQRAAMKKQHRNAS